jgi:flagellar basal body P-ring formation protein FlgA
MLDLRWKPIFTLAFAIPLAMEGFGATLAATTDIPVPKVTINAGQKIQSTDLQLKSFFVPENAASTYALDFTQVQGRVAKRALPSGKPIALALLRFSDSVVQGNPTKVYLAMDGLVISTILVPLQSGTAGQIVDARNPDSGKIVKAKINADGTLQIGAP